MKRNTVLNPISSDGSILLEKRVVDLNMNIRLSFVLQILVNTEEEGTGLTKLSTDIRLLMRDVLDCCHVTIRDYLLKLDELGVIRYERAGKNHTYYKTMFKW